MVALVYKAEPLWVTARLLSTICRSATGELKRRRAARQLQGMPFQSPNTLSEPTYCRWAGPRPRRRCRGAGGRRAVHARCREPREQPPRRGRGPSTASPPPLPHEYMITKPAPLLHRCARESAARTLRSPYTGRRVTRAANHLRCPQCGSEPQKLGSRAALRKTSVKGCGTTAAVAVKGRYRTHSAASSSGHASVDLVTHAQRLALRTARAPMTTACDR